MLGAVVYVNEETKEAQVLPVIPGVGAILSHAEEEPSEERGFTLVWEDAPTTEAGLVFAFAKFGAVGVSAFGECVKAVDPDRKVLQGNWRTFSVN